MRRRAHHALALACIVALAGCSKKDNTPSGLCARGCTKLLGCLPGAESQQDACVQACLAGHVEQAQVEKLESTSCDDIGQAGGMLPTGPAPTAATPANNGCTADCRGCVSDGTSCYAAAGGANGIPCEPCCCAPGGPAPTWK
jgi:hypothetical protein